MLGISRHSTTAAGAMVVLVLGFGAIAAAQKFVWPPTQSTKQPEGTPEPRQEVPQPRPVVEESGWDTIQPVVSTPATPVAMPAMRAAPAATGSGGAIDWRILENPQGPHTALFFDPVSQVFAVYHVDSASGQIMLKSVRNVSADLRLEQFNSSNPAPKDIQSMLDEAR